MGFRDDGEAVRARLEVLERERDDALQEVGRLQVESRQAAQRADDAEKRVGELESAASALPARPSGVGRWAAWTLIAFLSFLVLYLYLTAQEQQREAHVARAGAEEQTRQAERLLEEVRLATERATKSAVEASARAERAEARLAVAERALLGPETAPLEPDEQGAAAPSTRSTQTWAARVRGVSGSPPVRRGQRCQVRAAMEGQGTRVHGVTVDVLCGETKLYDWNEPIGSGMQMRGCTPSVSEESTHPVVELACTDQGARTGRPQLALDTANRAVSVWRDGVPTFRVELSLTGRPTIEAP